MQSYRTWFFQVYKHNAWTGHHCWSGLYSWTRQYQRIRLSLNTAVRILSLLIKTNEWMNLIYAVYSVDTMNILMIYYDYYDLDTLYNMYTFMTHFILVIIGDLLQNWYKDHCWFKHTVSIMRIAWIYWPRLDLPN